MTSLKGAALAIVLTGISPGMVQAQSQETTVYASIMDQAKKPVTEVSADQLVVKEDGSQREILRVAPATDPIRLAVLVDTSTAMQPHQSDFRKALKAFFKAMEGKGEIALIGFGERPTILAEYTRDLTRLNNAADRVFSQTNSGTYVLEAIVDASRGLAAREGRSAIVVITAEGPDFSVRDHRMVIEQMKTAGTTLHLFSMTSFQAPFLDESSREREQTFAKGTQVTGGRREDLLSSTALEGKLMELATELNNQVRIVYARPERLVQPEEVTIDVKKSGLKIRASHIAPPRSRRAS